MNRRSEICHSENQTWVLINQQKIYGLQIHASTRCLHYHRDLDIIAIKFKCCQHYYACYLCHLALSDHPVERWQPQDLHKKLILCGFCGIEFTLEQYLTSQHQCSNCQSHFNPRCKLHWNLYFEEDVVSEN
jgi:uncharacterized CHY-type Zn-finger protein